MRSGLGVWRNLGFQSEGLGVEERSVGEDLSEDWLIGVVSQNRMVELLF